MCMKINAIQWAVTFITLTITVSQDIPDVTLISQKVTGSRYRMNCVISGNKTDSAIVWNTPLINKDYALNSVSAYIPPRTSPHNCNINFSTNCSQYWINRQWRLGNSFQHQLEIVTDRRWEEFKLYYTSGSNEFQNVKIMSDPDFKIHFSVRIREEAHIFLCDNENPPDGHCYWILLGGWNGNKSAIRKCVAERIPAGTRFPRKDCAILRDSTTHSTSENVQNEMLWRHFTIEKKSNNILVWKVGEKKPLLDFTDQDVIIFTSHLNIRSRMTPGYWKFHNYTYTYTKKEKLKTKLGPQIVITEGQLCVTMFVAMCDTCRLVLEVFEANKYVNGYREQMYKKVTINPKKGMVWQEEKFVVKPEYLPATFELFATATCSDNDCNNPFWAIDDFQICSEKEIRALPIEQENPSQASCQVIKYPQWNLTQTKVRQDMVPEWSCPPGTFTKNCIQCSSILGESNQNCENSTVCDLTTNGKTICRCASGYMGANCETECPSYKYGFDCKDTCGFCKSNICDHITGECKGNICKDKFVGSQCKTPSLPVLLHPPVVIEYGPTYCKAQIQNNSYEGLGKPSKYTFQYREQSKRSWKETKPYDYSNTSPIEIKNLNILTTYEIQALLITVDDEVFNSYYVPSTYVTTTCAVIGLKDITITPSNTSAVLSLKNNAESCKSEDYSVILDSKEVILSNTFIFNIKNLKPGTVYNVSVKNIKSSESIDLDFKTSTGEERVEKLCVIEVASTFLTVSWEPPQKANKSEVRDYYVQYKHLKYLACPENNSNADFRNISQVKSTSITIRNLRPYSEYIIEVVLDTVAYGESTSIRAHTLQTDIPGELEIPSIAEIEPQDTTVKIFLNQPDCTQIKGPVVYHISTFCSNSWCIPTPRIDLKADSNPITISGLLPYSNYTFQIKVGRKNGKEFIGREIKEPFNTQPSVPSQITNLTAYSKDENSISLRNLPPYPPNGEIEMYFVNYCYSPLDDPEDICKADFFKPRKCKVLTNFHCITLTQLITDKKYNITVQAKNVDTIYNDATSIEVQTIKEDPGMITNLTSKWDRFYNLTLCWNPPITTDEPLTNFEVSILSENSSCYNKSFPITQDEYTNVYCYTIPFRMCFSSRLNISVSTFNKFQGLLQVWSPPKTPSLSLEPFIDAATDNNITINLTEPNDLGSDSVLYVVVSIPSSEENSINDLELIPEIWGELQIPSNTLSWIAAEFDFREVECVQNELVIGNGEKSTSHRLNKEIHNQLLNPGINYLIRVIIINEFEGFKRYSVYKLEASTSKGLFPFVWYGFFALPLLLILGVLCKIFLRKRKRDNTTLCSTIVHFKPNSKDEDKHKLITSNNSPEYDYITPEDVHNFRNGLSGRAESHEYSIPGVFLNNKLEIAERAEGEFSKPVKISKFREYVKESIDNGELEKQHQLLFPPGPTKPWGYGLLPQNKHKNRYDNIIAYDHSRVKLTKINKDQYSDYINANYIEGHNSEKAYIATESPKESTVYDFWRMIWQEKVSYIVMLANVVTTGKTKTVQYWPNVDQSVEFVDFKVKYSSSRVFAHYEHRKFLVSLKNVTRKVEQFHFTSWPVYGMPLYPQSLVSFLRRLLTLPQAISPIVVHCRTGVGRTGIIILCDLCLRVAAEEGIVDVPKNLHNLREQRANLIDNKEQYKLAHLVLLESLVAPQTSISCEKPKDEILRILESNLLVQQMGYLKETAWQDEIMRPRLEVAHHPEWSSKNRFQDIVPSGYGRVYLSWDPTDSKFSNYINAVEVDSFCSTQRFIVTQQPLPSTVSDFWRMVYEKKVTTVVSLNEIDLKDETSCIFWPTTTDNHYQPLHFLTLKLFTMFDTIDYTLLSLHLYNSKDKEKVERTVKIIFLKGWPAAELLPNNEQPLLKLWEKTEKISKGNAPIVVTCYNGAKASGLFVALSFVIDKINHEHECDVALAVRTVRRNRKQFVTETDQYSFLYRAAVNYLSCFDMYANFKVQETVS